MSSFRDHDRWFVFFKRRPSAEVRLFCCPYAGGGSAIFKSWSEALPITIEVCAVELPGRGTRFDEPVLTRVEPLITELGAAIHPLLDKPFAFFGHSMGSLLGFELSRHLLSQHGLAAVQLFASGQPAPQLARYDSSTFDLPTGEFIEELRSLNGTPRSILEDEELMRLLMPVLRADFEVEETYKYLHKPPMSIPISVFSGLQDKGVSKAELEPWGEQTTSSFTITLFPGDHFFIHSSERAVLNECSAKLRAAMARKKDS